MKKNIYFVLFIMVAMIFSICSSVIASDKLTLTVMTWGSTVQLDEMWKLYKKNNPEDAKNIEFISVIGGKQDPQVYDKFRKMMAAGEDVPDIIRMDAGAIPEFAISGALTDLSEFVNKYKNQILPTAPKISMVNKKYYGVPQWLKPALFYYREDVFNKAGVNVEEIKTYDDLIKAGKKIIKDTDNDSKASRFILNMGPNDAGVALVNILMSQNDGRIWDEKGNVVLNKDKNSREVFELMKKCVDAGIVAPIDDWTTDWYNGFADGTIVGEISGSWFSRYLKEFCKGSEAYGKWKVRLLPAFEPNGDVGASEHGGASFVIPAKAKNKEAALKFLEGTLLNPAVAVELDKIYEISPIVAEAWKDPYYNEPDPFYGGQKFKKVEFEAIEKMKVMAFAPNYIQARAIINFELVKVLYNNKDLDTAINDMAQTIELQIGNPWEF